METNTQAPAQDSHSSILKVAAASFIGTAIEWYDFFLYGTAAALVFNRLFFPSFDPLTGTLASFATFAVGFVARPLGGVVFGHFGDKLGRKTMLSATLMIMGVATFAVGMLPTYESIGAWAPALTASPTNTTAPKAAVRNFDIEPPTWLMNTRTM